MKKETLYQALLPQVSADSIPTNMSLAEIIEKFRSHATVGPIKSRNNFAGMATKRLLSVYSPKEMVGELSADVFQNLIKKLPRNMKRVVGTYTKKMLIFAATGEINWRGQESPSFQESPNGSQQQITFKFSTLSLSEIKKTMPAEVKETRFAPLQLALFRQLQELPAEEFGIIALSRESQQNIKERKQIQKNLRLFISKQAPDWEVRWNPVDLVFVVGRTADWNKINSRKGEK